MGRWRTDTDAWLAAEQEGRDETADAALNRVLTALPAIEPSPAFAARAAEAAWAASTRRRRLIGLAAAAAAVVLAATVAVVVYTALGGRVAWLLTTTATAASGAALSLLAAGVTLAGWWSAAATAGRTIATAVATPYSVAALVAIELVAGAALVMLHRLLRSEVELRTPRAYCF
jgi:hypothetical protein